MWARPGAEIFDRESHWKLCRVFRKQRDQSSHTPLSIITAIFHFRTRVRCDRLLSHFVFFFISACNEAAGHQKSRLIHKIKRLISLVINRKSGPFG